MTCAKSTERKKQLEEIRLKLYRETKNREWDSFYTWRAFVAQMILGYLKNILDDGAAIGEMTNCFGINHKNMISYCFEKFIRTEMRIRASYLLHDWMLS